MKTFNVICLAALLDHHGEGFENAHPDYIAEKIALMERCNEEHAFGVLDTMNQGRVRRWAREWRQKDVTDPETASFLEKFFNERW